MFCSVLLAFFRCLTVLVLHHVCYLLENLSCKINAVWQKHFSCEALIVFLATLSPCGFIKRKLQPNFYNIIGESTMLVAVNNKRKTVTEGVYTTLVLIVDMHHALEMTFSSLAIKSVHKKSRHKIKYHMYLINMCLYLASKKPQTTQCVSTVLFTSINAAQPFAGGQRRFCSCCHGVDVLLVCVWL